MAGALIDDVFDVLEGTFDELLRTRPHVTERIERLVLGSRMRQVRCAVAALAALMRGGFAWRPAADGHEADTWRDVVLETLADPPAEPAYVAMVTRELDEFVGLARPGDRRPLPDGGFERLARQAGVAREECIHDARRAGDDRVAGWNACETSRALTRIPIALGITPAEVTACACRALLAAAPADDGDARELLAMAIDDPTHLATQRARIAALFRSHDSPFDTAAAYALDLAARGDANIISLDTVVHGARRVAGAGALREHLTTPAVRAALTASEPS